MEEKEVKFEELSEEAQSELSNGKEEGVDEKKEIQNDYEYLLDLADEKRKEIAANYENIKVNVRPLVLIQFPMGQPETIKAVEDKLASMGYTYDNGMVNIWMSDEKIVSEDLINIDQPL